MKLSFQSLASAECDSLMRFPIRCDQIRMLLQRNCCSTADLAGLGIQATHFDADSLRYLSASSPEVSSSHQDAVYWRPGWVDRFARHSAKAAQFVLHRRARQHRTGSQRPR